MDYHDSSAGNARLAVIKLTATKNKLGTVFFNPGKLLYPPFVVFHQPSSCRWTCTLRGPGHRNRLPTVYQLHLWRARCDLLGSSWSGTHIVSLPDAFSIQLLIALGPDRLIVSILQRKIRISGITLHLDSSTNPSLESSTTKISTNCTLKPI